MRTKNIPRNVLVHFVRKKTRDQMLQQQFNTRLKIGNIDITDIIIVSTDEHDRFV